MCISPLQPSARKSQTVSFDAHLMPHTSQYFVGGGTAKEFNVFKNVVRARALQAKEERRRALRERAQMPGPRAFRNLYSLHSLLSAKTL